MQVRRHLDGSTEARVELPLRAEEAGHEVVKYAPELQDIILRTPGAVDKPTRQAARRHAGAVAAVPRGNAACLNGRPGQDKAVARR